MTVVCCVGRVIFSMVERASMTRLGMYLCTHRETERGEKGEKQEEREGV